MYTFLNLKEFIGLNFQTLGSFPFATTTTTTIKSAVTATMMVTHRRTPSTVAMEKGG